MANNDYHFSNDWFGIARETWSKLLPQIQPSKILEIGSFEGRSACFMIDTLASSQPLELHCVDSWETEPEYKSYHANMESVSERFNRNTATAIQNAAHPVDLHVHKGRSDMLLSRLLTEGKRGYFDFIYIDGSHQAADVLCDAVLGFRLLRQGGVIAFDDYLYSEQTSIGIDPLRSPKPAIDAFVNLYCRKLRVIQAPLYQLYIHKIGD